MEPPHCLRSTSSPARLHKAPLLGRRKTEPSSTLSYSRGERVWRVNKPGSPVQPQRKLHGGITAAVTTATV